MRCWLAFSTTRYHVVWYEKILKFCKHRPLISRCSLRSVPLRTSFKLSRIWGYLLWVVQHNIRSILFNFACSTGKPVFNSCSLKHRTNFTCFEKVSRNFYFLSDKIPTMNNQIPRSVGRGRIPQIGSIINFRYNSYSNKTSTADV